MRYVKIILSKNNKEEEKEHKKPVTDATGNILLPFKANISKTDYLLKNFLPPRITKPLVVAGTS